MVIGLLFLHLYPEGRTRNSVMLKYRFVSAWLLQCARGAALEHRVGVFLSVYVIHTVEAGEDLTFHRPPQYSGNDFLSI